MRSLFKLTGLFGSNKSPGVADLSSTHSSLVNHLIKTGSPFHTIYITSPGGSAEISTSMYVSRSYLFHPESLPIMANANNLPTARTPPIANVLAKYIYVFHISVSPSLCNRFSSNQLSSATLWSIWSPKFDGLAGVTKNFG